MIKHVPNPQSSCQVPFHGLGHTEVGMSKSTQQSLIPNEETPSYERWTPSHDNNITWLTIKASGVVWSRSALCSGLAITFSDCLCVNTCYCSSVLIPGIDMDTQSNVLSSVWWNLTCSHIYSDGIYIIAMPAGIAISLHITTLDPIMLRGVFQI